MARERFNTVYKAWKDKWLQKSPPEESLLVYEGRTIDLYTLHYEVLRAGGPAKVSRAPTAHAF